MKVSEFRYDLPERLIAQEPTARRDASRLLVLDRGTGKTEHQVFRDLPGCLNAGDLLVVNDTRVIPARLAAVKPTGGRIEVLLLERVGGPATRQTRQEWRALVRGFGHSGEAVQFRFGADLAAEVVGRETGEVARVVLTSSGGVDAALEVIGEPPTPPYVRRSPGDPRRHADRDRYQTVYARAAGAVAAPTAGLHFTREILDEIRARGVAVESLTLHVGWGTFQPVRVEDVEDHAVDPELYEIPRRLAASFEETRRNGGRVVAVGTTVTRALEYAAREDGTLAAGGGRCDLFIRPGHHFRAVEALLTNFHLPESSLLMLAAAFAGKDRVLSAYREAVEMGYRFYSYGDAMFIR